MLSLGVRVWKQKVFVGESEMISVGVCVLKSVWDWHALDLRLYAANPLIRMPGGLRGLRPVPDRLSHSQ